jgi:hypothetical protein
MRMSRRGLQNWLRKQLQLKTSSIRCTMECAQYASNSSISCRWRSTSTSTSSKNVAYKRQAPRQQREEEVIVTLAQQAAPGHGLMDACSR